MRAEDIDLARDRRLVEAWQAGDPSAFDDLYRLYFDRLRAFCARRVADPAEADDIAQEAFLKAFRALPRLSGERRFYPWMTVIASRLCIDHHRKQGRVEPSDAVDAGSVDDGHDARYALQADLHNLDRALRRLGPRHAEVLQLREGDGLSYHEIAGQLGVPHSTVEALLFRARRALRREFQLVSAERLAAIPGIGWLLTRGARLRARVPFRAEVAAVSGAIATGAVTVALVALPSPTTPAPSVVTVAPRTTVSSTAVPASPSPAATAAATPPRQPTPPDASRPGLHGSPVAPMSAGEAKEEATGMPVYVQLEGWGLGADPDPLVERLTRPLRSQP